MNETTEQAFEKIAAEAISKAEKVNCEFDDFVSGLRIILDEVGERWRGAREERAANLDPDP